MESRVPDPEVERRLRRIEGTFRDHFFGKLPEAIEGAWQ